jgi:hypothetical protein
MVSSILFVVDGEINYHIIFECFAKTKNLQLVQVLRSVRRIRFELTRPVVWALPPQGSASTNFAIAAIDKSL